MAVDLTGEEKAEICDTYDAVRKYKCDARCRRLMAAYRRGADELRRARCDCAIARVDRRRPIRCPPSRLKFVTFEISGKDAWYCETVSFSIAHRGLVPGTSKRFAVNSWFSADTSEDTSRMTFDLRGVAR